MLKRRLLLIPPLATLLIYTVALFWSIYDYQELKRTDEERLLEKYGPEITGFVDYWPYIETKQGETMVFLGFALGLVSAVEIGVLGKFMEYTHLKSVALILPVVGFLCLIFGILAYFYYEPELAGFAAPLRDYSSPLGLLGIVFMANSLVVVGHVAIRRGEVTNQK